MKNKILTLLFGILMGLSLSAQNSFVPNTASFSLWDVLDAVTGGHASGSLSSAFAGANSGYFDPTYNTTGYASANSMLRFRNYRPASSTTPTVTTSTTTATSSTTASSGGNIASDGGASVTARGVCWSTAQFPTTVDSKTADGTGTGSYSSSITGLSPQTTYYLRAYATNANGTSYGSQLSITTPCQTPSGLTSYILTAQWSVSPYYVQTQATAIQCLNDVQNNGASMLNGLITQTTLNNGDIAYANGSTDCTPVSASQNAYGWYIARTATGNVLVPDKYFYVAPSTGIITIYDCAKATITTGSTYSTGTTTGASGGNVTAENGTTVTAKGVCWNTTGSPTTANSKTTNGTGTGSFTSSLTGLSSSTTYYVRAYATNSMGTAYGSQASFTTDTPVTTPSLTTASASSITYNSATSGGNISSDGGATVTARGVCWNASGSPTIANNTTSNGSGIGSFSSGLTGLNGSTTYYVRAYASNSAGTAYGNQISFTTAPTPVLPTVTTTTQSGLTCSSVTLGGNVTADGYATVTERGVCYSGTVNPTTANAKTVVGSGTGVFSTTLSISSCAQWHVRAYAINSVGTSYGSDIAFYVNPCVPTVTTTAISGVTSSGASTGGNVTFNGCNTMDSSTPITDRGVCYATTANPTTANSTVSGGTGTGVFSSTISGLAPATTYYVRAYATNSSGTGYGTQVSFTTSATTPSVNTTSASAITQTTATSGGNITSDGGASVTARGVCWSTTSGAESTAGSKTTDGTGSGSFSSSITGLTHYTTYYVKAYATNSAGTSYGSEVSFTTQADCPSVSLGSLSATSSSITVTGNTVLSDGGAPITDKGVNWNTTDVISGTNYTHNGTGTASYNSTISGLSPNTTYYVRAFVSNGSCTAYGSSTFITTPSAISVPTVSTTSASSITNTSMSSGGNVTADGGATVTERGVCWSTSSSPTISGSHVASGSGTGTFTGSLTGLTGNTYYYYRAYATNSQGTAYGGQYADTTYPTVSWSFTSGGTGDYISVSKNGTEVVHTTSTSSGSFQCAWGDNITVLVEGGNRSYNECHMTINGTTYDDLQTTPAQSTISKVTDYNVSISASTHE